MRKPGGTWLGHGGTAYSFWPANQNINSVISKNYIIFLQRRGWELLDQHRDRSYGYNDISVWKTEETELKAVHYHSK